MKRSDFWIPSFREGTGTPSYRDIASALISDIKTGRLAPGTPIPSQRTLAKQLKLSLTTVTRAFQEVSRRGLIIGEPGRGTFVKGSETSGTDGSRSREASSLGLLANRKVRRLVAQAAQRSPPFPTQRLLQSEADAQEAGVRWVGTSCAGVAPEQIVAFEREGAALITVLTTIVGRGKPLFIEPLIAPSLLSICGLLNITLIPTTIDEQGVLPESLEATKNGEGWVLLCSPTFQNPTNTLMTSARRESLIAAARHSGGTIIEIGDYDRLRPGTEPISSLAPDIGIYVANISATTFGAVDITFVAGRSASEAARLRRIRDSLLLTFNGRSSVATRAILNGTAELVLSEIIRDVGARSAARQIFGNRILRMHAGSPHGWLRPEFLLPVGAAERLNRNGEFLVPEEYFRVARHPVRGGTRVSFVCFETVQELNASLWELKRTLQENSSQEAP